MADVRINVTAADQTQGVFERVAKRLRAMQAENRLAGETALERTLSSPKGIVGAVMDVAGMGIAGIIIDQVGKGLANITQKMIEYRDRVAEGTMQTEQLYIELLKSVPVLGGFASAGENIAELISNAKHEAQELARALERSEKVWKAMADAKLSAQKIVGETGQQSGKLATQIANVGADSSTQQKNNADEAERARLQSRDSRRAQLEESLKATDKQQEALDAANEAVKQAEADQKRGYAMTIDPMTGMLKQQVGEKFLKRRVENAQNEWKKLWDGILEQEKAGQARLKEFDESEGVGGDRGLAGKLFDAQEDERTAARARAYEEENERVRQREQAAMDADQKLADQRAEAGKQQRAVEEQLKAEADAKELANEGKKLESELALIQSYYRRRIEEAKTFAEREALIRQMDADEEAARLRDWNIPSASSPNFNIRNPSLQISSRGSGAAARAREENAIMSQLLNLNKQATDHLKFIREATRATSEFFKTAPQFAELLMGVN